MEGRDGSVVREPMVTTDDAETYDVSLVVEDIETFGGASGGETGNDVDLTETTDVSTVSADDAAAFEEVFVSLRVVEAANDGPYGRDWSGDLLDYGGATLVRTNLMRVETSCRRVARERRKTFLKRSDHHRNLDGIAVGYGGGRTVNG